jgi:uncharacterized protein (DUF2141 family)
MTIQMIRWQHDGRIWIAIYKNFSVRNKEGQMTQSVRRPDGFIGIMILIGWMLACNLSAAAATAQTTPHPATKSSLPPENPTLTATIRIELPTATATFPASPTPTLTASPTFTATVPIVTLIPGSISGMVWHDLNQNKKKDAGEFGMPGLSISLGQGACLTYGFLTDITGGGGEFYFSGIAPGVYCVRVIPDVPTRIATTTNPWTVTLGSGKNEVINFGLF